MAKGIPGRKADIGALKVRRLEDVPLEKMAAFKVMAQKEDKNKEKYEVEQVNLSMFWNSGFIQRKEHPDGEPVLDSAGNEQVHYINAGFVTLSGHFKATLAEILKSHGFGNPEWYDDEGSLLPEVAETIEAEFGTNGLGHNYTGRDWDDLPMYVRGGDHKKGEIEVPVTSFKIMGFELLGRRTDMTLEIKNGYNRVGSFIEPRDPLPLGQVAKPAAKGIPAPQAVEDPFEDDKPPFKPNGVVVPTLEEHGKGPVYIWEIMEVANVPVDHRLPLARYILSEPTIKSVAEMNVEQCRSLRDLYKGDNAILVNAYNALYPESADGADEF